MLDNGQQLFQFQGNNSNAWERFTGNQLCVKIRTERQGKKPHLCVIDEQDLYQRQSDPLVRAFCALLHKPASTRHSPVSPPVLELPDSHSEPEDIASGKTLLGGALLNGVWIDALQRERLIEGLQGVLGSKISGQETRMKSG